MTQSNVEFDHYPEKFEGNRSSKRIELLGLKEHFADADERRKFFASLTDEEMQKMVGYINTIGRDKQLDSIFDYESGQLPFLSTPSKEHKAELMQHTYEAVRDILQNDAYSDDEALERAGLTFAGAINLIHPYDNGNGRTGRLMHYLTAYGTERQPDFDNEVYAIIAKLPVYDTDHNVAIYDQVSPELIASIDETLTNEAPSTTDSEHASQRALIFLDVMTGKAHIPISREMNRWYKDVKTGEPHRIKIEPGIDGYELYAQDSHNFSAIPNRSPDEVPDEAQRVIAKKPDTEPGTVSIQADLL